MTWPADSAACTGLGCPLRTDCQRYLGHEIAVADRRPYQTYFEPQERPCEAFLAAKDKQ